MAYTAPDGLNILVTMTSGYLPPWGGAITARIPQWYSAPAYNTVDFQFAETYSPSTNDSINFKFGITVENFLIGLSSVSGVSSAGTTSISGGPTTTILDIMTGSSSVTNTTITGGATTIGVTSASGTTSARSTTIAGGPIGVPLTTVTGISSAPNTIIIPGGTTIPVLVTTVSGTHMSGRVTHLLYMQRLDLGGTAASGIVIPGPVSTSLSETTVASTFGNALVTFSVFLNPLWTTATTENITVVPGPVTFPVNLTTLSGSSPRSLNLRSQYNLGEVDLKAYKSKNMSTNPSLNGGTLSPYPIRNITNNIFPRITETQRLAGRESYRKVFWKNDSYHESNVIDFNFHLDSTTSGGDWITFTPGGHTEVESDLTGGERQYGIAKLSTTALAGTNTIQATLESDTLDVIRTNDTVWVGDVSNSEMHSGVSVVKTDADVVVTLATGDTLKRTYKATKSHIASVYKPNSVIVAMVAEIGSTTASGVVSTTEIDISNKGTVLDTWNLEYTDDVGNFACAGTRTGALNEVGSNNAEYAPVNELMDDQPYFKVPADFWTGSWVQGDKVTFKTYPAAIGIWFKQTVPSGLTSKVSKFNHRISGYK